LKAGEFWHLANLWCMQNSCMNFEVYWWILQHIKMLLEVIIIFCIYLWGFSTDPPYFGYNFAGLFCVFWHFRNLPKLKLTWDSSGVNVLSREESRAQEVNEGGHEAQTILGGTGPWRSRATQVRLVLEPPMSSMFVSDCSAWPKNAYIKTPQGVLSRRGWTNTKLRNIGYSSKDRREKHCRSHLQSLLQPLQHQQHRHHHVEL
jgi:hypothetical protein